MYRNGLLYGLVKNIYKKEAFSFFSNFMQEVNNNTYIDWTVMVA